MEFPWEEILFLTNGKDVNGFPLSAGTIGIDRIRGEQADSLVSVPLAGATFMVHMSGGSAVVTADFPQTGLRDYQSARMACERWMEDLANEKKDDQALTLTITPLFLEGAFYLVFQYLMYVDGYTRQDKTYRLILGFDNNGTMPFASEGVDVARMILEADKELQEEINNLQTSILMAEEEEQKAKEQNPYEESVKEQIKDSMRSGNTSEGPELPAGFRISEKEDDTK